MKSRLFSIATIFILFISSCKKDQVVALDENATCSNTTLTINDTLLALIGVQTSSKVFIKKIQNGISDTVASQVGFEFWGPSISPNKSKFICFRSPTGNPLSVNDFGAAELWLFNIDGSNGHSITTLTSQGLNAMGMAKWAPDGFHIVFAGEKNEIDGNLHWNIYLTDTLGTLGTKMNTRLGSFKFPAFANGDMTKLTYEAWIVGVVNAGSVFDTELHLSTVNGSFQFTSETRLTTNDFNEYSPSFSPDNLNIVYCQNTSLAASTAIELYIINISSAVTLTLLSNNSLNENPVWCPTNNKIYFANKSTSFCFSQYKRIDINGDNAETPYKQMNQHFSQLDIR